MLYTYYVQQLNRGPCDDVCSQSTWTTLSNVPVGWFATTTWLRVTRTMSCLKVRVVLAGHSVPPSVGRRLTSATVMSPSPSANGAAGNTTRSHSSTSTTTATGGG